MRPYPRLFAVLLCAASVAAAHAQQANSNPTPAPSGTAKLQSRISFNYDAAHGQINATGVQFKSATTKSESESQTTGTIVVTIHIKMVSRFESGTTYHCSVDALGGIIDTDNGTVDGGLETANNFATGSGGAYACTLKIPYAWTLPHDPGADSGLVLAFGVSAVNSHSDVERSTLQVDGIENLPANASTSRFVFEVAL